MLHSAAVARRTHKRNEIKQTTIKILQHSVLFLLAVVASVRWWWRVSAANCNARYIHQTIYEKIRQTFTFLVVLASSKNRMNERRRRKKWDPRPTNLPHSNRRSRRQRRRGWNEMLQNMFAHLCTESILNCTKLCVIHFVCEHFVQTAHGRDTIWRRFEGLCIISVLRKTERKK